MQSQSFAIKQRLPGLNEYIHAVNINRYKGNALKRETQDAIGWAIKAAHLEPVTEYPVTIFFEWHEKSKRRDLDNIASAKKFILDALQECGILEGDGQKQIAGFADGFVIGDVWDGCVVIISFAETEESSNARTTPDAIMSIYGTVTARFMMKHGQKKRRLIDFWVF